MYLLAIFFLVLIIPFLIIPPQVSVGILSPYRIVLLSILGTTTAIVLAFMAASFAGESIYMQLHEAAESISREAAANPMIIDSLNMADVSEADRVGAFMRIYDAGLMCMPVTLMFLSAVISYIAYIIISRIIGRKRETKKMPKFREFTFGHSTAMAMMLMYVAAWLILQSESPLGEMMYVNINMLFDLVFSLQGIAVVMMFCHFKRIPQIVAVLVGLFMWLTSIGKMFLVLMGIADLVLGLRIRMGGNAGR